MDVRRQFLTVESVDVLRTPISERFHAETAHIAALTYRRLTCSSLVIHEAFRTSTGAKPPYLKDTFSVPACIQALEPNSSDYCFGVLRMMCGHIPSVFRLK